MKWYFISRIKMFGSLQALAFLGGAWVWGQNVSPLVEKNHGFELEMVSNEDSRACEFLYPIEDMLMMPQYQVDIFNEFNKKITEKVDEMRSQTLVVQKDVSFLSPDSPQHGFVILRLLEINRNKSGFPSKLQPVKSILIRLNANKQVISSEISLSLADKVNAIWRYHCGRIKTDRSFENGLDGQNYFFGSSQTDFVTLSGKTWSPREGTTLYKLVRLADALSNLEVSERSVQSIDLLLSNHLQDLKTEDNDNP